MGKDDQLRAFHVNIGSNLGLEPAVLAEWRSGVDMSDSRILGQVEYCKFSLSICLTDSRLGM
jgi:hypothetical protein